MIDVNFETIWRAFEQVGKVSNETLVEYKNGWCDNWPPYSEIVEQGKVLDLCDGLLTKEFFVFLQDDVHLNVLPSILAKAVIVAQVSQDGEEPKIACGTWRKVVFDYFDIMSEFWLGTVDRKSSNHITWLFSHTFPETVPIDGNAEFFEIFSDRQIAIYYDVLQLLRQACPELDIKRKHNLERVILTIESAYSNKLTLSFDSDQSNAVTCGTIYSAFKSTPTCTVSRDEKRRMLPSDKKWHDFIKRESKSLDLFIDDLPEESFARFPKSIHLCMLPAVLARMHFINLLTSRQIDPGIASPTWLQTVHAYLRGMSTDIGSDTFHSLLACLNNEQLDLLLTCLSGFRNSLTMKTDQGDSDDAVHIDRMLAAAVSAKTT